MYENLQLVRIIILILLMHQIRINDLLLYYTFCLLFSGYFNSPELPDIVEKALNEQENRFQQMKVFRNIHGNDASWSRKRYFTVCTVPYVHISMHSNFILTFHHHHIKMKLYFINYKVCCYALTSSSCLLFVKVWPLHETREKCSHWSSRNGKLFTAVDI